MSLLACGPAADTKNHIVVGAVLDRTGINSELSWGDALTLATSHVNRAMTELGYKNLAFKMPIRDSAGIAASAVDESQKLVNVDGAKALLLASSDEDLTVNKTYYDSDVTNDLNVPLLCSSCTSSSMNLPTTVNADTVVQLASRNSLKWNFRGIMSTKLIAKVLAGMVLQGGDSNGDGKLKVAFYAVNDSFGTGSMKDLDAEIKLQLPGSGLKVPYTMEQMVHPREVDTNSYNWANDVSKLVDTYNDTTMLNDGLPDIVVSSNLVLQESAFTRAYAESRTTIRLLHFHTMRASSALRAIAQLAEGQEGVSHLLIEHDASGDTMKAEYETAFGTPIVYRDPIYYDSGIVMLLGILKATMALDDPSTVTGVQVRDGLIANAAGRVGGTIIRTGKDEMKKAIEELKAGRPINYEGAAGPVDMDDNFNIRSKLARYKVVDGVFVDQATYDCVSSTDCPEIVSK